MRSAAPIAYFGPDQALLAAVRDELPGATVALLTAGDDHEVMVGAAASGADVLAWRGVQDRGRDIQVRLAVAEAGFAGLLVYRRPHLEPPGFRLVDGGEALVAPAPAPPGDPEDVLRALTASRVARRGDGPDRRGLDDELIAAWASSEAVTSVDPESVAWPLVHRHPLVCVGLVKAAIRGVPKMWAALAARAVELPFRAPRLGWARRAYAETPDEAARARLSAAWDDLVTGRIAVGDVVGARAHLRAWDEELPGGPARGRGILLAAALGDLVPALASEPRAAAGGMPALEAELLRLRGRARLAAGDAVGAAVDLEAALALEITAEQARDWGAWESAMAPSVAATSAPSGGAATRLALIELALRAGDLAGANAWASGLSSSAPAAWVARALLASARGDTASAWACWAAAVAATRGTPLASAEVRARHARQLHEAGASPARVTAMAAAALAEIAGVPLVARLELCLALRDVLPPDRRAQLDTEVAFALDELPADLGAVRTWRRELRGAR